MTVTTGSTRTIRAGWAWTGYAAFVVGLLYALVSAYWAMGGVAWLDTLGGSLEDAARARDPLLITVVWVTAAIKLVAAVLGLALVRPWGRLVPRWMLLTTCWTATAVLVLYGGYLVVGQLLVVLDLLQVEISDEKAFYGHLLVWDPWFLVWGLLLGAATWAATRPGRSA